MMRSENNSMLVVVYLKNKRKLFLSVAKGYVKSFGRYCNIVVDEPNATLYKRHALKSIRSCKSIGLQSLQMRRWKSTDRDDAQGAWIKLTWRVKERPCWDRVFLAWRVGHQRVCGSVRIDWTNDLYDRWKPDLGLFDFDFCVVYFWDYSLWPVVASRESIEFALAISMTVLSLGRTPILIEFGSIDFGIIIDGCSIICRLHRHVDLLNWGKESDQLNTLAEIDWKDEFPSGFKDDASCDFCGRYYHSLYFIPYFSWVVWRPKCFVPGRVLQLCISRCHDFGVWPTCRWFLLYSKGTILRVLKIFLFRIINATIIKLWSC